MYNLYLTVKTIYTVSLILLTLNSKYDIHSKYKFYLLVSIIFTSQLV